MFASGVVIMIGIEFDAQAGNTTYAQYIFIRHIYKHTTYIIYIIIYTIIGL